MALHEKLQEVTLNDTKWLHILGSKGSKDLNFLIHHHPSDFQSDRLESTCQNPVHPQGWSNLPQHSHPFGALVWAACRDETESFHVHNYVGRAGRKEEHEERKQRYENRRKIWNMKLKHVRTSEGTKNLSETIDMKTSGSWVKAVVVQLRHFQRLGSTTSTSRDRKKSRDRRNTEMKRTHPFFKLTFAKKLEGFVEISHSTLHIKKV